MSDRTILNNHAIIDNRKVLSGKDGVLFADDGTMLATVENFQSQLNVTNAKYQPLGDPQEHEVFTGYGVTLTLTETVISDERFFTDLFEAIERGEMPVWNFQGLVRGRNDSEQRINYRQCVPSGNIDLQNLTVGDTIKRQWSLFVNEPPELQKLLQA